MTSALDHHWWGLPGPQRFLGRIADAALSATEGLVGLLLPRYQPQGILDALAARLESSSSCQVVSVDAKPGLSGRQPLRVLASRAGVDTAGLRQTAEIVSASSLADTVFLVHGIRSEDWVSWSLFIRTFRAERRSLARMAAPTLVVVPPPGLTPADIRATIGAAPFRWSNALTRLDSRMHAERVHGVVDDSLLARVALETTVEFAGWDPEMIRDLAQRPYKEQVDPVPHLRLQAKELGLRVPSWENALVDFWDGAPHVHTLSLIAAGDEESIRARLWAARVRAVFPFIDMVRHAFVSKYEPFLRRHLPYEKRIGANLHPKIITEVRHLEFTELRQFLRNFIPHHEEVLIRECLQLRRAMAHSDPGFAENIEAVSVLWDDYAHTFQPECAGWDWPRCSQKLVLMVGPSGAGKSTYARAHYAPDEIISSDAIRQDISGGLDFDGDQGAIFERVRQRAVQRLSAGLRAVIDATHIKTADRVTNARLVPPDIPVEYVVIDRSMEEKQRDGGWRVERGVLQTHARQFAASLPEILDGDRLTNVQVTVPSLNGQNTVVALPCGSLERPAA